jgi:hypothetical protein
MLEIIGVPIDSVGRAGGTPGSRRAGQLVGELDREVDEIVLRRHEMEKQLDAADRLARSLRTVARRLGGEPDSRTR